MCLTWQAAWREQNHRAFAAVLVEMPPPNVYADDYTVLGVDRRSTPRMRLWNSLLDWEWLGYSLEQRKRSDVVQQQGLLSTTPSDASLFHGVEGRCVANTSHGCSAVCTSSLHCRCSSKRGERPDADWGQS
jgi:hypothetical protein